jgi:hypothetical protein
MTTKIRVELFATEKDAKVHVEVMKAKGYANPSIERAEVALWDATKVTNGVRDEASDFDDEMWVVISRK